uniref:Pellino n=2 Tax=Eptatretus burgeri TaxID=7764 RepID=A0A8C4R770_EPTBU
MTRYRLRSRLILPFMECICSSGPDLAERANVSPPTVGGAASREEAGKEDEAVLSFNTGDSMETEALNVSVRAEQTVPSMTSTPMQHENKRLPLKYGELIVLGYNGSLTNGDKGRRRSRFALFQRPKANSVSPSTVHFGNTPQAAMAVSSKRLHSVSYTLSRTETVVVEYDHDAGADMFQIGRSTENPIDFVVTDVSTSAGGSDEPTVQSTISRFACRVVCQRTEANSARIFAAGFDSSKNIFLGEKAEKWKTLSGQMDGLTTNGILVMHPTNSFSTDSLPGPWREISVCGKVYTLRETRSALFKGQLVANETNVLRDGSLIDLCGATLLWRTAEGLKNAPTVSGLEALRQKMNATRPQCPVGLNTLAFPSFSRYRGPGPVLKDTMEDNQPWVYLVCGHVHGRHDWGVGTHGDKARECPMCRTVGPYVALSMGREADSCVDAGTPMYAFSPCGHICSEGTARYWARMPLPYGTHGFHAICPFCNTALGSDPGAERPFVRLIFQGPLD